MSDKKVKSYNRDAQALPALKRRQAARSRLDDIQFMKSRGLAERGFK